MVKIIIAKVWALHLKIIVIRVYIVTIKFFYFADLEIIIK